MKKLKFNNLRNALKAENRKRRLNTLQDLNSHKTIKEIRSKWRMRQYLTPYSSAKKWVSVRELKEYLKARINKRYDSDIDQQIKQFDTVLNSGDFIECTISIEWKKNRTWGSNPRATIKFGYKNDFGTTNYNRFEGDSIGGCGYDKQSTAVANVLNGVNPLLKLLYKAKNKQPKAKNSDVLGYGAGYGILPSIEGGVGVGCYPRIFEKIGFNFETVASGSNFDVYKITKAIKKRKQ